jgi:hypothetical protein
MSIVLGLRIDDRTDDREPIGTLIHFRQQIAEFHARDVRRRGTHRAGDLGGGVGLHVPHVLMRRAADEVDHDDGFVATLFGRDALFGLQELTEGESAEAEGADLEKFAAAGAAAELGWKPILRHIEVRQIRRQQNELLRHVAFDGGRGAEREGAAEDDAAGFFGEVRSEVFHLRDE